MAKKYGQARVEGYGITSPLVDVFPPPIRAQRSPTNLDIGHRIGQIWINENSASADFNDVWILTSIAAGLSNWEPIGNDTDGGVPISKYVVDVNGGASINYTTIQSAIDAANAAGVDATVYVRPGTYTENLTLYDGIDVVGSIYSGVTITGTHTPPASGTFTFQNCTLTSATDIFTSAAAGTTTLSVHGCIINCTNGYVYDLVNWTGTLVIDDCGDASTANGIINNTGGATIRIIDSDVGAGANTYTMSGGTVFIDGSVIDVAGTFGGAATVEISDTDINGTVTTADTAAVNIMDTEIATGVNSAISHGSAGILTLSNITIDSTNAAVIAGAGAGFVDMGHIDYRNFNAAAATIRQRFIASTNRITPYIVGPTGNFDTIQAAIDAASFGGATERLIYVQSGGYVEDLTFYDEIHICGACAQNVRITGTHTPPASGDLFIQNCRLVSLGAESFFNSAVAGTTNIEIDQCDIYIENGYVFNLPNWTGSLVIDDCSDVGVGNGIINNTGGATINIIDSDIGVGANTYTMSGGNVFIDGSVINVAGTFGGAATVEISDSDMLGTITTAGTATVDINSTLISTGADAAISHGSASPLSLIQVTIDSANATPIGGAGAGALDLGNVDFVTNSVIAGTLTTTYMRSTDRVTPYVVGPTGNYATIQAALDAATSTGIAQTVYVQPGTYVEDLTLYDGMTIRGENIQTTITGVHTPPNSGAVIFIDLYLTSATDIITSAAAGTTRLRFETCTFNCTNGYVVDCASWTGPVDIFNCNVASTADGVVNVAASTVAIEDSFVGAGANALGIAGGTLAIINSRIACPISPTGACAASITQGSFIGATITTAGTTALAISNSTISSGANAAISQGSAGALTVSNTTITSAANPCITGAGAGAVTLTDVNFTSNAALVGTLTMAHVAETKSTKLACGDSTYPITTLTADYNVAQAFAITTATIADQINAIEGNMEVASGASILQPTGMYGYCVQDDGSAITSTAAGVEGHLNLLETDNADLPVVYAFAVKGYLDATDATGIPGGLTAGVGSVVEYNTPFNSKAYGFVATRLDTGGGAGTAGYAAFGVAQGTVAAADWDYGMDFYGATQGFTYSDIRFQNQSTVGIDTEGVVFSGDVATRSLNATNIKIDAFNQSPLVQTNVNTGGVPTGVAGDINLIHLQDGSIMEEFVITAQAILAPRMTATGLEIGGDQIATNGWEYNWGVDANRRFAFVSQTSAAFFIEATFTVTTVANVEYLWLGFRKNAANNANYALYTDGAMIGLHPATNPATAIIAQSLNGPGWAYTNTTDGWVNGSTHVIRVDVSAGGVITYQIDGATPSAVPASQTFDAGDIIIPWIGVKQAAAAFTTVQITQLAVGYSAWY